MQSYRNCKCTSYFTRRIIAIITREVLHKSLMRMYRHRKAENIFRSYPFMFFFGLKQGEKDRNMFYDKRYREVNHWYDETSGQLILNFKFWIFFKNLLNFLSKIYWYHSWIKNHIFLTRNYEQWNMLWAIILERIELQRWAFSKRYILKF